MWSLSDRFREVRREGTESINVDKSLTPVKRRHLIFDIAFVTASSAWTPLVLM